MRPAADELDFFQQIREKASQDGGSVSNGTEGAGGLGRPGKGRNRSERLSSEQQPEKKVSAVSLEKAGFLVLRGSRRSVAKR